MKIAWTESLKDTDIAKEFLEKFNATYKENEFYGIDYYEIQVSSLEDFLWLVDNQRELSAHGGILGIWKDQFCDCDYMVEFE